MNLTKKFFVVANNFGIKIALSEVLATIVRGRFVDKKFCREK